MLDKITRKAAIAKARKESAKIEKELKRFGTDKITVEVKSEKIRLKVKISTDIKRGLLEINHLFRKYRDKIQAADNYELVYGNESREFKQVAKGEEILKYIEEFDKLEEKFGPVTEFINDVF